ncbi:MAG TPA: EamA family transporter [Povalibacter sp.]|uniref:EamA family transporter n=1 Tax=Povalibacter sp. TaxID=1962978 RepID=UPI002C2E84C2|nr:EamA family transporter [Povalibacter sp.]HMN45813.1 EamA family transporter [Povalibacter sp.]
MNIRLPTSVSLSLGVLIAFAGIYIIWGTTYLAIAIAIQTLPPFISGAMRFLLAGVLMAVWLRMRSPRPFAGVNLPAAALCGVLLAGIGNGFVIWAQQGIPSGITALIVAAMPVTVLVLDWAWFSRRAPTRQGLLGTAIALAGVTTIVLHTRTISGEASPLHLLALIIAVVGWSFGTLLQKRAAGKDQVFSFTGAQMLFGGLFQLALSVFDGEWARFDPASVSTASWLAVGYLVVFGSLIGLNCYLWLLTRVSAAKVTTYALVNPVVALILGALVLHEEITSVAVIATLLVLFGVSLVLFQDRLLFQRPPKNLPAAECK